MLTFSRAAFSSIDDCACGRTLFRNARAAMRQIRVNGTLGVHDRSIKQAIDRLLFTLNLKAWEPNV